MRPGRVTKARPPHGQERDSTMAIKFRKGDIVLVQGTVTYDYAEEDGDDGHVHVEIPGAIRSDTYIKPQMLTMVQQVIVIGDLVKWDVPGGAEEMFGSVLAIKDNRAWIDSNGHYVTRLLSTIQRVEV